MDRTVVIPTDAEPGALMALVGDLASYPDWMGLVHRVVPAAADPADPGPAALVDLRGRIGPFARSKRLRMVREHFDPAGSARFARREVDGRHASAWALDAEVSGGELRMRLRYSGRMWGPLLEAALERAIQRDAPRLLALVEG